MRVLRVRNVHHALPLALRLMDEIGYERDSRNGPVMMAPEPVTTVYERPTERVLFHPWRDANPFFHFYESLWMLAGRNDVAPLARYVDHMKTFSDDGQTFNAAYGHRWRRARGWTGAGAEFDGGGRRDQLTTIIKRLRANKDDRRCVLQIWDHVYDLREIDDDRQKGEHDKFIIPHRLNGQVVIGDTKDTACNVVATLQIGGDGRLDMSLFCRSNDILWGAYGANAVHFSMLLEYVARCVGVEVGRLTQISVNWHAYRAVLDKTTIALHEHASRAWDGDEMPYEIGRVAPYPIMTADRIDRERWDLDCRVFLSADGRLPQHARGDFYDPFFRDVAWWIVRAHDIYKDTESRDEARFTLALEAIEQCRATDWRLACEQWLRRRWDRWQRAAGGGPQTQEES